MTATVGAFNIGDFIPYLDWFDFQGINRRMKKTFTTFNKFAEKVIDDHLNVNHLMSVASNDVKEGDAQPDVQDFMDVLLHMAKTDTNITRKPSRLLFLFVIRSVRCWISNKLRSNCPRCSCHLLLCATYTNTTNAKWYN